MKGIRVFLSLGLALFMVPVFVQPLIGQETKPSRIEVAKEKARLNRARVQACHKEAITKQIPRRNRATYEQECLKKAN